MKNSWRVESKEGLAEVLREINLKVPLHSEGGRKDPVERYCIARLLHSVPSHRLQFPLNLNHRERPDFVLSMPRIKIGIEHTEVVSQNAANASAIRERGLGPEVYFSWHSEPGEQILSSKKIIEKIEDDKFPRPLYGDSVERNTADAILHSINNKKKKCSAEGFDRYEQNWLLMDNNWGGLNCNLRKMVEILIPKLAEQDMGIVFDSVFILSRREMCEIGKHVDFYPVNEI